MYCRFCGARDHVASFRCPLVKKKVEHRTGSITTHYIIPDYAEWHWVRKDYPEPDPAPAARSNGASEIRKPVEPPRFEPPPMPVFQKGAAIHVAPVSKYHPKPQGKKS